MAHRKICFDCGKFNHFATVCRSGKSCGTKPTQSVKAFNKEFDPGKDSEELYIIRDVAAVTLDDTQLATLQLDSGNCLPFQPDTGAHCNVIPVDLYKKAAMIPISNKLS